MTSATRFSLVAASTKVAANNRSAAQANAAEAILARNIDDLPGSTDARAMAIIFALEGKISSAARIFAQSRYGLYGKLHGMLDLSSRRVLFSGVSQVIASKRISGFFIIALALGLAAAPAASAGPGTLAAGQINAPGTLLHLVDTFPTCAELRRCWRTSYGRLRCGLVTRCQECHYVRRCTRAGCVWRQVCKWGPYKPVLKTN